MCFFSFQDPCPFSSAFLNQLRGAAAERGKSVWPCARLVWLAEAVIPSVLAVAGEVHADVLIPDDDGRGHAGGGVQAAGHPQ